MNECGNAYCICNVLIWAYIADADLVIAAVIRHGSQDWQEIGLQLKLSLSQVTDAVHSVPTNHGKLLAVIEKRRQSVGTEIVQELLEACNNITIPIAGAVREELKRQGELKRHSLILKFE